MSPDKNPIDSTNTEVCPAGCQEDAPALPWGRALAFGIPACAIAGPNFLVQSYFLNFATDVLLLAPATVGLLLAGTRIWDAVSDPAVGFLSDRTRTRLGRRRPWLFAAAPLVAVIFYALWNPPNSLGPAALIFWAGASLLAVTTAATAWNIPHAAFGADLARDSYARSKIYGIRYMCIISGVAGSFGVMQWIVNSSDPRAAAGNAAWLIGAAMVCLLFIPPLLLRESTRVIARDDESFLRTLRAVAGNGQARRLLFAVAAEDMAMTAQGAVAPYMAIYVLERTDMIGLIPAFYIVPMVLSVPVWVALARKYGKPRVWYFALWGGSVSYASLFMLDAGDLSKALVFLTFAGLFSGCGGPMGPSMLADVIDQDASESGAPKEGVFFAALLFVQKSSGAFVVLLIGFSLSASGFVPNQPLTPASDFAIRACLAIAPALMFALATFALRRYMRESGRSGF